METQSLVSLWEVSFENLDGDVIGLEHSNLHHGESILMPFS